MNILIVGYNSMVAKHLIARLRACHTLFSASRGTGSDIHFDLMDETNVFKSVPKCDALIHCAASFCPDTTEGAEQNERINSVGCFQVSKLAVLAGCDHVIYLGSISSLNHPENEYYGSYGASKAHGEENLNLCCRLTGKRFTSLRLSQIYDDQGESKKHQPLLYKLIENVHDGKEIVFWGKKDPVRNYIHIDDVVRVIERTLITKTEGFHPVLFPTSYTISEIARLASKVFVTTPSFHFLEDRPDIKTIHIPGMSDLYDQLEYTPLIDMTAGITRIRETLYAPST